MLGAIKLFIIRHGETDWNAEQRYQGTRDIPINARGREQACRNGRVLRDHLEPERIRFVASPLSRAQETMRVVRTAMGLAPGAFATEPRIREVNYGTWQGQLAADLPVTDPAGLAAREANPFTWVPEDGESYAELMERTDAWLATLTLDTVAVTHGGVMRTIRGRLCGLDPILIPRLHVPQDKILMFSDGEMRWL